MIPKRVGCISHDVGAFGTMCSQRSRKETDMDYKELIEQHRSLANRWENGEQLLLNGELRLQDALRDAATAIETLLEERDAAVEDLRGMCWCCTHGKPWDAAGPLSKMTGCEQLSKIGVLARGGGKCKCLYWKWRGPQKGEGHEQRGTDGGCRQCGG